MSQKSRKPPSIDLTFPHLRISNRTTPSQKRHINSLPTELLRLIFTHYCDTEYGPTSLLPVCQLWHEIVSDYGCLWTVIRCVARSKWASPPEGPFRPILCDPWTLEDAIKMIGNAKLELDFDTDGRLEKPDEEEVLWVVKALRMCRSLRVDIRKPTGFEEAIVVEMPHLEELFLCGSGRINPTPFLKNVVSGSPRLRSLICAGSHVRVLLTIPRLLERLAQIDIWNIPVEFMDRFFLRLNNLEHLRFTGILNVPRSSLPRLSSLYWSLPETIQIPNQQAILLPALEDLTIDGDASFISFISAPRLKRLSLIGGHLNSNCIQHLRTASIRPISLFISKDKYPIELLPLLASWSGLLELHLMVDTPPGTKFAEALSGTARSDPVCRSLRYLTVHLRKPYGEHDRAAIHSIIHILCKIVEERAYRGIDGLQRVMCVWDAILEPRKFGSRPRLELEWVDVLDKSPFTCDLEHT